MQVDLTPRQAQALDILKSRPRGISMTEVAKLMSIKRGRTGELLRALRKLGLASSTASGGRKAQWATADRCKQLQEIEARRKKDRDREAQRRRVRQGCDRAALNRWLYPTQRCVSAASAERIQTTAPRSVFDQRA